MVARKEVTRERLTRKNPQADTLEFFSTLLINMSRIWRERRKSKYLLSLALTLLSVPDSVLTFLRSRFATTYQTVSRSISTYIPSILSQIHLCRDLSELGAS